MPGTEIYHSVHQSSRVQKRLVLNQCFRTIYEDFGAADNVVYVTFGGEDLFDVLDFVSVFDIRRFRLNVISYEQDHEIAQKSQSCPIASTLSQIETVRVIIVPTPFFDVATPLYELRENSRFIYFLDDTKPFSRHQASKIEDLTREGLLRHGDFMLITSCITPRIMHQKSYMDQYIESFKMFFGSDAVIDRDFKVRNHVELLSSLVFSGHDKYAAVDPSKHEKLRANTLRKFRYSDTQAAMGLWLFGIRRGTSRSVRLYDKYFEEFPFAFTQQKGFLLDIPDIFDSIH